MKNGTGEYYSKYTAKKIERGLSLSNENNDRNIGISYRFLSGIKIALYLSKLKISVFLRKYITKVIYLNVDIGDCFLTFSDQKANSITLHYLVKPVETIMLTLLVNNDMLRMFSNAGPWNGLVNFSHHFTIF